MTLRSLRVGDLAEAVGVSADTIRHYERKGVLGEVGRDSSGYRTYSPETLERLQIVRSALNLGFTLDELSRIFRKRAAGDPPCRGVRDLAEGKLAALDAEIAALTCVRESLARILQAWEENLQALPDHSFAHLLDSLVKKEGTEC